MSKHESEGGRHRDPLDRRRKPYEPGDPEVLGKSVTKKLEEEQNRGKGKAKPTSGY